MLSCIEIGPLDSDYFISYFQPETSSTKLSLMRFHFSPDFIANRMRFEGWAFDDKLDRGESGDSSYSFDDNLNAWREYCNNVVSLRAIDHVINGPDSITLAHIVVAQKGRSNEVDSIPMLRYLVDHKKKAAIEYLKFAFNVNENEYVGSTWRWYQQDRLDERMLAEFKERAIALEHQTTDPFLRERYQFQAVKIASELGDDQETIRLYDQYFEKAQETPIKYWALSRKAGALLHKGENAQALYQFAQVFDRCDSKKFASYLSIRQSKVRFLPAALSFCKNGRERAAVYGLCAIQPQTDALGYMREIVKAYPESELLELVMCRQINRDEYYYYPYPVFQWMETDRIAEPRRRDSARQSFEKLRQFALECAQNELLKDSAFWYMCASYIELVQKNFTKSTEHLNLASKAAPSNSRVTDQIALQRLLLYVEQLQSMTPEAEDGLIPLLTPFAKSENFRRNNTYEYSCKKIAGLYEQTAHTLSSVSMPSAKSFVFRMLPELTNENIMDGATSIELNQTLALYNQPNPSRFDTWLIESSGYNTQDIYILYSFRAMRDYDYPSAIAAYKHVSDTIWTKDKAPTIHTYRDYIDTMLNTNLYKTYLAANPFATGIQDIHRPVPADSVIYNPLTYAEKMQWLLNRLTTAKGATAAMINYELGCGTYNLSSRGNSWLLAAREVTGEESYRSRTLVEQDSVDATIAIRARKYFESAEKLSSDRELAARAAFMESKCERMQFIWYRDKRFQTMKGVKEKYWLYPSKEDDEKLFREQRAKFRACFNRLRDKYSDTRFNHELIEECGYYRDYVQGK